MTSVDKSDNNRIGPRRPLRLAAALVGVIAATGAVAVVTASPSSASPVALVSGRVTGESGRVDPAATVTVQAWPDGDTLAALPDGASVTPTVLATTHPDARGDYALDPDLGSLGADHVENGGTVNLEVTVTDSADGASESYTFAAARPGAAQLNPLLASSQRPESVAFDLHASTVTTALGTAPARTASTANTARAAAATTSALPAPALPGRRPSGCSRTWVKVKSYPKRPETFMNLWTVGSASVEEEVGSSHSLGVGVAVTGGSWSASGSVTVESHTASGGANSYAHSYSLRNNVNYVHLTQRCYRHQGGKLVHYYKHKLTATGMHSLLVGRTLIKDHVWGETKSVWKRRCVPSLGGTFHKTRGSNITFDAGVNTPFINLSAQAAFSKDTVVTWSLPRAGHTFLCGSTDAGPVSAPFAGEDDHPGPTNGGCGRTCNIAAEAGPRR